MAALNGPGGWIMAACLAVAPAAFGFIERLQGPTFANSSNVAASLSVVSDGRVRLVLSEFGAKRRFTFHDKLQMQSLVVTTEKDRYELDEKSYTEQSRGIEPKRQLWVFDGTTVCVLDVASLNVDLNPTCPARPAGH